MPSRRAQKLPAFQGAVPLRALASPVRQEIVSALSDGPATVKEIAQRLGRSRQALHYHVAQLVTAGIAVAAGERGAGRAKERLFRAAKKRIEVGASRSPSDLEAAESATAALLRLTQRELRAALRREGRAPEGAARKIVAMRAKCRLDPQGVAQLQKLINQIDQHLRAARRPAKYPAYALTIVLTPVRDAARRNEETL